jgi:hypothetical protein
VAAWVTLCCKCLFGVLFSVQAVHSWSSRTVCWMKAIGRVSVCGGGGGVVGQEKQWWQAEDDLQRVVEPCPGLQPTMQSHPIRVSSCCFLGCCC